MWWDRNIPPGFNFREVIGEALAEAKCVIVLWSRISIESDWVKEEATRAAKRLLPILIEHVEIPLGFGQIEATELCGGMATARPPSSFSSCARWKGRLDTPARIPPSASPPIRSYRQTATASRAGREEAVAGEARR